MIFIYPFITTALFLLGSRTEITRPLWSNYELILGRGFARFMDCPMCVGTWWGFISAFVFGTLKEYDFGPLPGTSPLTVIIVGLFSLVTTPIGAAIVTKSMEVVGQTVPSDDVDADSTF